MALVWIYSDIYRSSSDPFQTLAKQKANVYVQIWALVFNSTTPPLLSGVSLAKDSDVYFSLWTAWGPALRN